MIKYYSILSFSLISLCMLLLLCAETPPVNSNKCSTKLEKELKKVAENIIILEAHKSQFLVLHRVELKKKFVRFQQITSLNDSVFKNLAVGEIEEQISDVAEAVEKGANSSWTSLSSLSMQPICSDSLKQIKKLNSSYKKTIDEYQDIFKRIDNLKNSVDSFVDKIKMPYDKDNSLDNNVSINSSNNNKKGGNGLEMGYGSIKYQNTSIDYYILDPKNEQVFITNYDNKGKPLRSIARVNSFFQDAEYPPRLIMNGGMYDRNLSAKGLFVAMGKEYKPLDVTTGNPNVLQNFYLLPNGVYFVDDKGRGNVLETHQFMNQRSGSVIQATQSGPMLLIDGNIHPRFNEGSPNVNIRNGVGILPDGRTIFAITNQVINFYSFASFFQQLGCRNALYLDGVVSRMHEPLKRPEDGDNLGVFIVVTNKK